MLITDQLHDAKGYSKYSKEHNNHDTKTVHIIHHVRLRNAVITALYNRVTIHTGIPQSTYNITE